MVVVDNGGGGPEIEEARAGRACACSTRRPTSATPAAPTSAPARRRRRAAVPEPGHGVRAGAIAQLVRTLDDPAIGIAMARLLLLDRPEVLNSRGLVVHVSGVSWAGGYGDPAETVDAVTDVAAASGTAMAIRARHLPGPRRLHGRAVHVPGGPGARLEGAPRRATRRRRTRRDRLPRLRVRTEPGEELPAGAEPAHLRPVRLLARACSSCSAPSSSAELACSSRPRGEGWLPRQGARLGVVRRNVRWLARHRRATQRLRRVPDRELARFLTPLLDPRMVPLPPGQASSMACSAPTGRSCSGVSSRRFV